MSTDRDPKTFEEAFAGRRSKLVHKMKTGPDLMNLLEDKGIITSLQRQTVKATPSEHDQVSELLDILIRCDDSKLPLFLELLEATNQKHVVDIILRQDTGEDESMTRSQSSDNLVESAKQSGSEDQHETAKQTQRKRRSSSSDSPRQRTVLGSCINTRAAAVTGAYCGETSPKRSATTAAERSPIEDTPRKATNSSNSSERDAAAKNETSTFSLKNLQQLIGKRQTPQLTAKLESISEPKQPHNVRSPASEYFVMYISDGETRARVVVFDRRHLYQHCAAVVGKIVVIQANSYAVRRNRDIDKYPEQIYVSLSAAPILHDDPNNNIH